MRDELLHDLSTQRQPDPDAQRAYIQAQLPTLHPFKAGLVLKYLKQDKLERAMALLQPADLETGASLKPPVKPIQSPQESPPSQNTASSTPLPSAGFLLAQVEQKGLEAPHSLECPSEDDPRWLECKRRAVTRIRLKSGSRLPFRAYNPRYGQASGSGAFVALMLALMLYYRDCDAVLRFPVFAVQWAVADVLGVSADTVQRWQKLPEVCRWVQSWRWLDPESSYHRAGMLYTVLWNPEHHHKKPRGDLLKLKLRSLKSDSARGATQRAARAKERQPELERLHKGVSLKARWHYLIPLNQKSLARFGEVSELVVYVTALAQPSSRNVRMEWAEQFVVAFERHLGLGDDPEARKLLYWKITLTCLRAMIYGNEYSQDTPMTMVRRALNALMTAQSRYALYNPGAYFSTCLGREGFFELADFYRQKKVA